ncbi:MAG: endonuclease/exonuclease/phosphatase family protein [Proteobacteria bacterium]|nr:endonuclease/exonuclease/phosphatase family protein [Pseudomonadota bacterium]
MVTAARANSPTRFRVATLNLEQDHKRWDARRTLIEDGIAALKPDVLALNEVSIPRQTARALGRAATARLGADYHVVQQSRTGSLAAVEAEALLTRFPVIETGNLDFRTRDMVALVARLRVGGTLVDVYVTHLYMSRGADPLRRHQVEQLLAWIDSRDDVAARIVCGDFNATLDQPSAALMAERFRPTQTAPTAFTPLADADGTVSHPYWPRLDRCIDYVWTSGPVALIASGVCFDRPSPGDPTLWPSDHTGVWADLELAAGAA